MGYIPTGLPKLQIKPLNEYGEIVAKDYVQQGDITFRFVDSMGHPYGELHLSQRKFAEHLAHIHNTYDEISEALFFLKLHAGRGLGLAAVNGELETPLGAALRFAARALAKTHSPKAAERMAELEDEDDELSALPSGELERYYRELKRENRRLRSSRDLLLATVSLNEKVLQERVRSDPSV